MQFGIETGARCDGRVPGNFGAHRSMESQVPAIHSEMPFLRAIADGWNGKRGVEIKCPSGTSVLESMQRGVVPKHYLLQCFTEMVIFGVDEWDFFVFCAEGPSESQLATVRMDEPLDSSRDDWRKPATTFPASDVA